MFASGTDVRKKERQICIRFTIGFDTISTSPAASGWGRTRYDAPSSLSRKLTYPKDSGRIGLHVPETDVRG